MINQIFSLFAKALNKRATKNFLNNVTFNGTTIQILRSAHARVFEGSTPDDIVIGDGFRFFSGYITSQNHGKIIIGKKTQIGFNCSIGASNSITIGNKVILADNITIMDNNNHPVNPIDRNILYDTDWNSSFRRWKYSDSKPIVIGDNVWIGSGVRINKGVTIGDGAVIAACTVVVKDVPANCICAGNPGKIVKTDIDQLPRLIPNDAK